MQEAVPNGGGMTAVLGLEEEKVLDCLRQVEGVVSVANYNCPGQIVITGETGAVKAAALKMTEAGARKCIPLQVSGPFHSPLLTGAGEKLGRVLQDADIQEIEIPYIANVTADYVTDRTQVKGHLKQQVSSSVKWQQSVERMIKDGVTTFIEIGPGKTLSGFVRKISRDVMVKSIEKIDDLDGLCC